MSARAERDLSVAIVATGDELAAGILVDTNSAAIARALTEAGYRVSGLFVLGDDEDALCGLIARLSATHAAIVISGGLGPTLDDLTRHAVARAAQVELVRAPHVVEVLRGYFERRNQPFPASNERQALFPAGATILENPNGTAPGFVVRVGDALVFALPGPPREMQPMLAREVLPRLRAERPTAIASVEQRFYLCGIPESRFGDLAGAWMAREATPVMGVTSGRGVLAVRIAAGAADGEHAHALVAERARAFRERFGDWIYSEDEPALEQVLGRLLIERAVRVSTAESCTGGLVAERLTRVAGISAVFDAGFVTYANAAKVELLGLDPRLIEAHGAVSGEVASAMALGAAARAQAELGIAVTGIAGPGGGSAAKPVGLVWIAVALDGRVSVEERRYAALGRDLIREFAATTALDLARRALLARSTSERAD